MSFLLSDIFVQDNPNIIVNIEIINQIETYFNLQTTDSISVSTATNKLLFSNNILTKLINDVYTAIQSDPNYDPNEPYTNSVVYIMNNISNNTYNSLDKSSFLNYLLNSSKLLALKEEVSNNNYLQDNYKTIIKNTIAHLLENHTKKINSSLSSESEFEIHLFSQIIPVFSVNKIDILPFTQEDTKFWYFLNHSLYMSVNHILNNSNSQLLLNEFNISNEIYINSVNFALGTNIMYEEKYFFLTRSINEIMLYSIKNLLYFKKIILLNGMSTYNITIGVILDLFVSKKDVLHKIASYDNFNLFYPNTSIENSVFFANPKLFDL